MAFTKKKKRRIVVDGHLLYWTVTGEDFGVGLSIMSDFANSGKVFASFDYHHIQTPETINGHNFIRLTDQFVITPYTVRQVILLAFAQGWRPTEKGDNLSLGPVDERIDLRLDKNRVSRIKESLQVLEK